MLITFHLIDMFLSLLLPAALLVSTVRAESFQAWSALAARQEKEKKAEQAQISYSNALSTWKPSDGKKARAKALCARGALRDRSGNKSAALVDYTDCLALDGRRAKIFHRRGQLRLERGEIVQAIDDFYKATSLDIRLGEAYADRARAYESQGDAGFAREDYKHACEYGVMAACQKFQKPSAPTTPNKIAAAAPRFEDCLSSLAGCADSGRPFSACVESAIPCERKSIKGCCPSTCLTEHRKKMASGTSEGQAFRETFFPRAACATLIDKR